MLPLRDSNPRTTTPFVVFTIITANVIMFFWELSLGANVQGQLASVAFVPKRFWIPGNYPADITSMFLSMFLHAGWLHLGGNMLYLWIFGDNIEDHLGHFKFLLFYLLCGVGATMSHALISPQSTLPAIGASGAIAGVLGAYLILFPRARVLTLIPLGIFIMFREIPAIFILGFWFVIQFFVGVTSLGIASAEEAGGVAYFAHIGGFLTGIILIMILGKARRKPQPVQPYVWPN